MDIPEDIDMYIPDAGDLEVRWPEDLLGYLRDNTDVMVTFGASNVPDCYMVQVKRFFPEPDAEHPKLSTCKILSEEEFERSLMLDIRKMDEQLKELA